jgi:hypothetical protein
MSNPAFAIYHAPEDLATIPQLRTILVSNSELAVDAVRTLDDAIASSAEVLILFLTGDPHVVLNDDQITRLQNRKVIGIGYGAATIFAALGLEINNGACAHYGAMAMTLSVAPNQLRPLPGLSDPAGIAHGHTNLPVDHIGMYIPRTSELTSVVDVIARAQIDPNYALIARQGHHILIGLVAPPYDWTPAYRNLFQALTHALHAYHAQPFARAVWETVRPGVYSLALAKGRSTNADWSQEWYVRFARPTTFSATLAITGSDSVMLIFMGEKNREHWTREDGGDGDVQNLTIDITEEDIQAIGDWYWVLRVTNFDTDHTAACVLTIAYQE